MDVGWGVQYHGLALSGCREPHGLQRPLPGTSQVLYTPLPEEPFFSVVVSAVACHEGAKWSPAADVLDGGTYVSSQVRFKLVGNLINITMIEGVIRGVDGALNVASNKLSFEFDALHNAGTGGFFQVGPAGMQWCLVSVCKSVRSLTAPP